MSTSSSPPQVGFYPPRQSVDAKANFSLPATGSSSSLPLRPEQDSSERPAEAPAVHPAYRGRSRSVRFSTIDNPAAPASAAPRPDPTRRISELPGSMPNVREPYAPYLPSAPRETSISPPLTERDETYQNISWTPVSRSASPVPIPPIPQEVPAPAPILRQTQQPQKPAVSGPTTSHRASERGSLTTRSSIMSLRGHAHDQLVSNEKHPYKSSKLRPRSESAAPSITSTVRTSGAHRKTVTPSPTPSTFAQRVFDAGKSDLLYDLKQSTRLPWNFRDEKHGVLDLTTLQRMQQHVLQQKLVEQVRAMGEKGTWMEIGIGETMKDYCQVTRDMEYMSLCALRGTSADPFLITTTDPLESLLLEEGQLVSRRSHTDSKDPLITPRLPYMKRVGPSKRRVRRLIAVTAAAIALMAPYLIATLVPTLLARVITTCIFIAIFAFMMAASSFTTGKAVLATLSYAAALIIFVGVAPPHYFY